jgi:hypothetical protein
MNIRVAQAGTTTPGNFAQVIKIYKPETGKTVVYQVGFDGKVKVDFSGIANDKVTFYKDNDHLSLHVIFADGSQVIIEPFFNSMGVLSNLLIDMGQGQDFTGTEFAAQFPFSTDQSVLPAGGDGGGSPASGADFSGNAVDPLAAPTPLALLGPEDLPGIQFTNTLTAPTQNVVTPTVAVSGGGSVSLTVFENALDLTATGIDLAAGKVVGTNPGSNAESAQVTGPISFTAGTSAITVAFANPAGDPHWVAPTVGDLAPGYSLHWALNASGELVGTLFQGATNLGDAIILQLSGSTSASAGGTAVPTITVTLTEALHHALPGAPNGTSVIDSITINGLVVEATDAGGNVATGAINITVVDDVPVNNSVVLPAYEVAEDVLPSGNPDGGAQTTTQTMLATDLAKLVTAGADAPVTIGLNGAINGTLTGLTQTATPGDVAHDIVWKVISATEIDGVVSGGPNNGQVVFTLIEQNNGDFKFELKSHVDNGGSDTSTVSLSLANVFTATDTDNDQIVIDTGASVSIQNDVPVNVPHEETPIYGVAEDALPGGNLDYVGQSATTTIAAVDLAGLVNAGADAPVKFAINPAIDGQSTGLTQTAAPGDAAHDIVWKVISATEIDGVVSGGPNDGQVVFTLTEQNNGDFEFDLKNHVDNGTGDKTQVYLSLDSVFTATDTDNDQIVVTNSVSVAIQNDVPENDPGATPPTYTVAEDALPGANLDNAGQTTTQTIAATDIAALVKAGADTPLAIAFNDSIDGTPTGLTQTAVEGGTAYDIVWTKVSATEFDGVVSGGPNNGQVVFTLTEQNNGDFQFELKGHVDNGGSDTSTVDLNLANVFTATDTDHDQVVVSAAVKVSIENDVPEVDQSATPPTYAVAEDALPGANLDNPAQTTTQTIAASDIAGLVKAGADSPVTIAFNDAIDGTPTGLTQTAVVGGTAYDIVWTKVSATEFDGVVSGGPNNGQVVFTLTEQNNGDFQFELKSHVDNAGSDTTTVDLSLANVFTAIDTDNDQVVVDAGVKVSIENDIPTITATSGGTTTETISYSLVKAGNVLYRGFDGADDHDVLVSAFNGSVSNPQTVNTSSSTIGVGNHSINGVGDGNVNAPDYVRLDFATHVVTTGNPTNTYSDTQHDQVTSASFTIASIQGNPNNTATVFVQIQSTGPGTTDDNSAGHNFGDDQIGTISGITVNNIAVAGTPVYSGTDLIGYVLSGLNDGDVVKVTGGSTFDRLIVGDYHDFAFSSTSGGPANTTLGGDAFTINNVAASVVTPTVFEVRQDESAGVNNTADPNPADDVDPSIVTPPSQLTAAIAGAGLSPLGFAESPGVVSGLFTSSVGADKPGTMSYQLSTSTVGGKFSGEDSGLFTTANHDSIHLYTDTSDPSIVWGVAGGDLSSGTKVFALTFDSTGHLWVSQFEAIYNPIAGSDQAAYDDPVSIAPGTLFVTGTITDTDGDSTSALSQVPIKVTFQDDGPQAVNDTPQTVAEDFVGTIGGNVMSNDKPGADGATVTAVDLGDGNGFQTINAVGTTTLTDSHGTYTFKADGTWTFDPALNQNNVGNNPVDASFTYRITDGDGDTSTAVQPISITDGADPSASIGRLSLTVYEAALDTTKDGNDIKAGLVTGSDPPLTTETDQSTALTFTAHSDNITGITFGDPSLISVSGADPSATFAWTVNGSGQLEGHLGSLAGPLALILSITGTTTAAAGGGTATPTITATLTDAFPHATGSANITVNGIQVVATDTDSDTATATVAVTVVDDVPQAVNDTAQSVTEDAVGTIGGNVMANDTKGADGATVTAVDLGDGNGFQTVNAVGTTTLTDAHGTYTFKADGTWTFDPALNQNNSAGNVDASFTYQITDGDHDTSTAVQPISITDGANPTYVNNVSLTVYEAALDTTKDGNDIQAGLVTGSNPSLTTETAQSAGLTFTAHSDNITGIAFGSTAGISVTGADPSATFAWTVNASGQLEGHLGTLAGPLALILSITGTTTAAAGGGTATPTITATLTDAFPHATGSGDITVNGIQVVATDTDGSTATATIGVTVVDDVPQAVNDTAQTVAEDAVGTIGGNVMSNDKPGADGATVTAVDLGDGNGFQTVNAVGTTTLTDAHGTYTFKADGTWTFDPALNQNNSAGNVDASFTYKISDGDHDTSTAVQPISITDGANPTYVNNVSLTVYEAALDLTKDPNDIKAGLVTGSNPSLTTETAQSTGLTFTAHSDNITGITFGSTAGISVTGADPSATFAWTVNGSGQLEGHLGSLAGPLALILSISGTTTAAAGGSTATPTITATLTDAFPHATGSGNITVNGIQVVATDTDSDTATATIGVTVVDDVPTIGAIQNAIMPTINGTDAHGTWSGVWGADGPNASNALKITMGGTSSGGLTYATTDMGANTGGDEVYKVDVKSGANVLYSFYEYSHYDAGSGSATMYGLTNLSAAMNGAPTAANEMFTLTVDLDGTYDFHLVSNAGLPSTQTFAFDNHTNSGQGDYLIFNGTTSTYGSGNDPSSGYDILVDGWVGVIPFPNFYTVHGNNNGLGIGSGNFNSGNGNHLADTTMMFKFAATQSDVEFGIGKSNNANYEHFTVTIYNSDHSQSATEDVRLADGSTVIVDAAHWGSGSGYTGTPGDFFNFSEVQITNVAVSLFDEDNKVNISSFKAGGSTTISNTELNFALTMTDGDKDTSTSGADSLQVNLQGTHSGNGYQLTGTTQPEVLVATANADTFNGGSGTGDTVDYSNSPTKGVVVDLLTPGNNTNWAAGDTYSGVENIIGTNFADTLRGDNNANILVGGLGADTLTGNGGADTFKLTDLSAADIITDYSGVGGQNDVIDLTSLFKLAAGHNISEYVQHVGNTLQVDTDGNLGGASPVTVATFTANPAANTINIVYEDASLAQHTAVV